MIIIFCFAKNRSEGLPRFEGIETVGIVSRFLSAFRSEGLPRFEGIETVELAWLTGPAKKSEGLPRFEGIETLSFVSSFCWFYLVRRLAPI